MVRLGVRLCLQITKIDTSPDSNDLEHDHGNSAQEVMKHRFMLVLKIAEGEYLRSIVCLQFGHSVSLPEPGRVRGHRTALHSNMEDAERGDDNLYRAVRYEHPDSAQSQQSCGSAPPYLLQEHNSSDYGQAIQEICSGAAE